MNDDTDYIKRLRAGVRRALIASGINPAHAWELSAASTRAGLNRRFFEQYLDGTVKSPRAVSMRKALAFLGVSESDIVSMVGSGRKVRVTTPPSLADNEPKDYGYVSVPEHDVRATGLYGGSEAVVLIQERPLMGERLVSSHLIGTMHPNASPVVIRVLGDGMAPTYPSGCSLLVDAGVRSPSPPGVYVLWDGLSHTACRCQVLLGANPPLVRLSYDNAALVPVEVPLSDISVCGWVAGMVE